jgi:hypothetical protein
MLALQRPDDRAGSAAPATEVFRAEMPVELHKYLILKSEPADLETWLKIS